MNDKLPPPGTTELASLVGEGEEDVLVFGFQEVGGSSISGVNADLDGQTCEVKRCYIHREMNEPTSGKPRYCIR